MYARSALLEDKIKIVPTIQHYVDYVTLQHYLSKDNSRYARYFGKR